MTSSPSPLWTPSQQRVEHSQMFQFMTTLSGRYGFAANWGAFHDWSIRHSDLFWQELVTFAQIELHETPATVRSGHGMLGTTWFAGTRLNFAQHCLRWRGPECALLFLGERGERRRISRDALWHSVTRLATALRQRGVQRGDRVAGFLPNLPEAVIAMLATTSIGAIWSSCSPDFGVRGVLDRFGQIEPRVLFVADGYSYNGKPIDSLPTIAQLLDDLPTLEHAVVVPYLHTDRGRARELRDPRATEWSDFADFSVSTTVSSVRAESAFEFERVPFDHPLYIMYSSGTTGTPKCIVHGHGGTLLQHMKELQLHCDLRPGETIFYFTTCGWMMWNWLISGLGVGATVALYEGSPSYPDLDTLWRLAGENDFNILGTSPKFIAACQSAALDPRSDHDLSPLRALLCTGAPLTGEQFEWVYQHVKEDLQLSSICGGTDIISCFMLGNPMLPVYKGEIQCRGLGMDVQAFDSQGHAVTAEKGELVCTSPFPSQPVGFWNDPDGSKYFDAYFQHYPETWRHGDFIEITPHGGIIVYGRSDATLNPGGVRIGTAEIYRLVEALPEVVDSIAVSKRIEGTSHESDIEIALFVVLVPKTELDDPLRRRIQQAIVDGSTRRHLPRYIFQVDAIPYTISGKKVELAVQQRIHGEDVQNRDALANPGALDAFQPF